MKYIKLFEKVRPKYWLIRYNDDINYIKACLYKVGMSENDYWYNFALRQKESFYLVKIGDEFTVSFLFEKENLEEDADYQGEIIPDEYEINAIKYNL